MPAVVETIREKPWHGLGQIIQDAPTSKEAIKIAGLDWDVIQQPVIVGNKERKGYKANVRSDNDHMLGIVTDRYKIVQNRDAFAFTDELLSDGDVRYETAGSLKDGRVIWMLAKMEKDFQILGDQVEPYLCFTNTHDGTGAVKVLMTPIRVVCQNTLNLAIKDAKRMWSTVHMGNLDDKLKEAQRTLGLAGKYMDNLNNTAEKMVEIKVSEDDWKGIVAELVPIQKGSTERQIKVVEQKRIEVYNKIQMDDIVRFRGTGWAAINAVADYVTHVQPKRSTSTFKENLFQRVIGGDNLLDEAMKLIA